MEASSLEPWLADMVDAALAPYRGRLGAEDLAWMREQLVTRLSTDPELARRASDARGRAPVDASGKILRRDVLDGPHEPGDADGPHGAAERLAAGGRRDG